MTDPLVLIVLPTGGLLKRDGPFLTLPSDLQQCLSQHVSDLMSFFYIANKPFLNVVSLKDVVQICDMCTYTCTCTHCELITPSACRYKR